MKILGLHYSPYENIHDVAAALIIDGKVCGNYEEERFTRVKHACGKFPLLAIKKLLAINNLSINDIDVIACNPMHKKLVIDNLKTVFLDCKSNFEFMYDDHHNNHIYNAYYQSNFSGSTAAIVIDGDGDQNDSITIAKVENGNISVIKKFDVYQSLGNMYEFCTSFCGLGDFGEGKLMGLAAFGKPYNDCLLNWKDDDIHIPNTILTFLKYMNINGYSHKKIKQMYFKYLATHYYPYKKLDFSDEIIYYADFAATVQNTFNSIMINLVKYAKKHINSNNLILCGGCVQNCTANELIVQSKIFENVYAAPNSHDAGIALGSAFYALVKTSKDSLDLSTYNDKYYNFNYSIDDISPQLRQKIDLISITQDQIVEDLINNKIIGWFQDGSEIGHRALCHRSIIANPANRSNLNIINKYIKHRELFRPLAPVIPEELFSRIFGTSNIDLTEYMLRNIKIKNDIRKKLIAVCHVDGTTRPQCLKASVNTKMHNILMQFYNRTGIPGLINTSFNRIQEPIVESIDDAIRMLLDIDQLNYIVFNGYIKISRKNECQL